MFHLKSIIKIVKINEIVQILYKILQYYFKYK